MVDRGLKFQQIGKPPITDRYKGSLIPDEKGPAFTAQQKISCSKMQQAINPCPLTPLSSEKAPT